MRRRIKRSSLVTMIAVAALLSLGIGYAAWTSTITIEGTVSTAEIDVEWTAFNATEGLDPQDNGECTITQNAPGAALAFSITGAYPGYSCDFSTTATNNGSLDLIVTDKGATHTLVYQSGTIFHVAGYPGIVWDFHNCPGDLEIGYQLGAGDSATCESTVTFTNDVAQGLSGIANEMYIEFSLDN